MEKINILDRKFIFNIIADVYINKQSNVKKYEKSMLPRLNELLYMDEQMLTLIININIFYTRSIIG